MFLMRSIKALLVRAAPLALLAGFASATTINITESMQPVLDLLDFLPSVIERLPSIVIGLAVLAAIVVAVMAVASIFAVVVTIIKKVADKIGEKH
jgi:ABC-type proline/glycine betaine transport system permease subunit